MLLKWWSTLLGATNIYQQQSIISTYQQEQNTLSTYNNNNIVIKINYNNNKDDNNNLLKIINKNNMDIWDYQTNTITVMTNKNQLNELSSSYNIEELLSNKELKNAIKIPDIKQKTNLSIINEDIYFFKDYQPLSIITSWMELLSSLYSNHTFLINIGKSYENRNIKGFKIGNDENKKTIIIMGGTHSREWISISTINYIAYNLITLYEKDEEINKMINNFNFIIIPTINPDGYLYTWENDRLWRKNRQSTHIDYCTGIDLDKSFPFQWKLSNNDPCSESFSGLLPNQGYESNQLINFIQNLQKNTTIVGIIDLHAYSQQILYPFGYNCHDIPPSLENLEELAIGLSKSIRLQSNHIYISKQACKGNIIDNLGGSSLDWFYHDANIKYSYQIKLRDRGAYGFLLPKEHIIPTGKEIFNSILYFGKYLNGDFEF